ncbi:sporulation protein YunB [Clostridia bacterium]|nr:sporulation protein YunB [Clostridia bacterium]
MRSDSSNKKTDKFITAFCSASIVILLLVLFLQIENKHIEPYIKNICDTKGKQEVTRIITESIDEVLLKQSDWLSDLINITTDSNNNVKSIQTNTIKFTVIENEIIKQINKNFSNNEKTTFKFPIGSMTPFYTLAGKGFNVKLRLMPLSNIHTEIKSDFISAGINQTKHRLTLILTADTTMLMPTYKAKSTAQTEYLLAETIIVGDVPNYILRGAMSDS